MPRVLSQNAVATVMQADDGRTFVVPTQAIGAGQPAITQNDAVKARMAKIAQEAAAYQAAKNVDAVSGVSPIASEGHVELTPTQAAMELRNQELYRLYGSRWKAHIGDSAATTAATAAALDAKRNKIAAEQAAYQASKGVDALSGVSPIVSEGHVELTPTQAALEVRNKELYRQYGRHWMAHIGDTAPPVASAPPIPVPVAPIAAAPVPAPMQVASRPTIASIFAPSKSKTEDDD